MRRYKFAAAWAVAVLLLTTGSDIAAQKKARATQQKKPIIFAVLDDGTMLEPIAYLSNKKLVAPVNGSDKQNLIAAFNKSYYRPGSVYRLVFGGVNAGTVTVKSSDATADCSRNMAAAITKANKTPLKGFVMGLATDSTVRSGTGLRRRPSLSEREEIEAAVRAEFKTEKLTPKDLRYHNLTILDLDNDQGIDFVGSYWTDIDKLTRGLLFFIGEKKAGEKPEIGYREYRVLDQAGVMSGEIKSVDEGIYHELLLDTLDYDGDGSNEIFTYVQSFEGAEFNAYRRDQAKWSQIYKFSNYHCGY